MNTFIVYVPEGVGCFLEIGIFTDLELAIANTPDGGHVEQLVDGGSSSIVFQKP